MRTRRRDAGLNLIELQITVVLIAVIVLVIVVSMFGFSIEALKALGKVVGGFLALVLVLYVVAGGAFLVSELRGRWATRRALAAIRAGSPAADGLVAGLRWDAAKRLVPVRDELLGRVRERGPARAGALRLLAMIPAEATRPDIDDVLVDGAGEWPSDLTRTLWDLARSEGARVALVKGMCPRMDAPARRRFLGGLFSRYVSRSLPDSPSADWIAALAPFADEIRALDAYDIDRGRRDAYLAAFPSA